MSGFAVFAREPLSVRYLLVFHRESRDAVKAFYERYKSEFGGEVLFVKVLFAKSQDK